MGAATSYDADARARQKEHAGVDVDVDADDDADADARPFPGPASDLAASASGSASMASGQNPPAPAPASASAAPASATVTETTPLVGNRKKVHHFRFRGQTSSARFWVVFSQILVVQFLVCFDATITVSSHPFITSYFGAARSASWLSTSFLLASTAFQPLLGRLSDSIGRKPIFLCCLVIFGLATSWCALARSIDDLIAARAFCGLGAGGLMTLGNIMTSDLVPIERRGLYQPYSNIVYGIGGASGAALGGIIAETLGWRWEFGVQIPLLGICLAVSLIAIPKNIGLDERRKSIFNALREFDMIGSALLAVCTASLILGLNLGGNILPWKHPFVIASFCVFGLCIPIFVWVESSVTNPIMPPNLIWQGPRANLLFSNFIAAMLTNGILFNIPIFFRAVLLSSATSSGLRLMLPSVVSSITSAATGFAITWTHKLKWPLISGAVCSFVGGLVLCSLKCNLPSICYFLILVPSFLGQGFQYTGSFMAILATSSQSEQAIVISTLLLFRNLGMVVGIASSSLILQNSLIHYLNTFVHGAQKTEVVASVKSSIDSVLTLMPPYQEQVIMSFEASLRLTFICLAAMALVGLIVVLPLRLPRLMSRAA